MIEFLRTNFRWILGGFALTFFSSFGQTYFIAASIAEWQAAFALSHGEIGRLYMFATLASAACLPFLGKLVDVVPAHKAVLIVVPTLAFATLLAGYADRVWILVIAIFLLRLFGQGMMTHIALTATGKWFSASRGRAVSLVVLGHQGGEATLPLAFTTAALLFGYQAGWLAGTAALLFVGLPMAYFAYRSPRQPQAKDIAAEADGQSQRHWTRQETLRDPVFWMLLTGVLAPPFIGTTIFYHQNYMTTLNDWPPQLFAQSLLLLAGTTVVIALLAGAAIDRYSARALLPYFLLPLAAACFALSESGPPESLMVVMLLLGISYGFSSTLFGALWPEVYGTRHLGAIRSVVVAVAVVATAAGPGLTGTLIDMNVVLTKQMFFLGLYCCLVVAIMTLVSGTLRRRTVVN